MKRTALYLATIISLWGLYLVVNARPVLFVNAHILTMDEAKPVAEALLVQGGRIAAVGRRSIIDLDLPLFTKIIDLHGRTLLPGFIDAHSHFPSSGLTQAGLDLTSPPVGTVASLQNLFDQVANYAAQLDSGDWVVGFNYDDASLDVARHPTRVELDQAAPDNPVYLWHRSGHMGVANSLALKALGYEDLDAPLATFADGVDEPDRHIDGTLTGLLQEGAAAPMPFLLRQIPVTRLVAALRSARDEYLAAGVTTVQNGFADVATMRLLLWLQRLNVLPQRVTVWPAYEKVSGRIHSQATPVHESLDPDSSQALARVLNWRVQNEKFKVSALKLVVDGSPQGQTAWVTSAYLSNGVPTDNSGASILSEAAFKRLVVHFHNQGLQLAIHGNGDAAIDLIIEAVSLAQEQNYRPDARHLLVHGQLVRPDQLSQLASAGISVTFFPAHTFFWGDWYRNTILGLERARRITPLALADAANVQYSIHSDAPVTPINPIDILWSATERETLMGFKLGPEFAISRERALRAMTLDAAWQNKLEHDRGSVEKGKLADLVVLSDDPLTIPDVRDLKVEQVWIGGRREF